MEIGTFVVVTTDRRKRGVFSGILAEQDNDAHRVVLTDIRMCVEWSKATRGVLGLAARGPREGSRVTVAAPRGEIYGVTLILEATPTARVRWEEEPWHVDVREM